uniref:Uncharacterized protein n=1 Tax=Ralstonia solanacearum TaxID=305 RepID=A0A0S4U6F5_RALSL|nr:protein of unknown function [Ralstonia solanacearum]
MSSKRSATVTSGFNQIRTHLSEVTVTGGPCKSVGGAHPVRLITRREAEMFYLLPTHANQPASTPPIPDCIRSGGQTCQLHSCCGRAQPHAKRG